MELEALEIIDTRAERERKAHDLGINYQEPFERVLAEAATTRLAKAHGYGESRYEEPDQDFNMGGVFWDIYRKYIRLRQLFKRGWKSTAHQGLRDALMDIAVYALMGVQLIDQYLGKKKPKFQIEQVALKCPDPEAFKSALGVLGLTEWSEDHVVARGTVFGEPVANEADLNFNYDLGPFEFELIKYTNGENWLQRRSDHDVPYGLSHLGLHVKPDQDLDKIIREFQDMGFEPAQELRTLSHTNPAIAGKRTYRYVILDTHRAFGFDLKLIQRINQED